jgi:hypothetical protein
MSDFEGRLRSAAKFYLPSLAKNAAKQKNLRISESGWAQTASTSLLHCSNDNFIPLQAAAIISALLNLNTPCICIRITHTHRERIHRRLNRSLTNIMRAFCARGAAPNEKKKIMNGCCCCFFSSSISFFRHASLESPHPEMQLSSICNFQKANAAPVCVCFVNLSALTIVYFFVDRNTLSGRERGE